MSSREHFLPIADRLKKLPFWLLGIILLGILVLWSITSRADNRIIFQATARGLVTTLWVSLVAFSFSVVIGLGLGLCRTSRHRVVRELSTFWVEIMRGIPMLVILYYIAFIGAPGMVEAVNFLLSPLVTRGIIAPLSIRSIPFSGRAIIALTLGYGAFISEIFRAGHRIDTRRPVGGRVRAGTAEAPGDGAHRAPPGGAQCPSAPG